MSNKESVKSGDNKPPVEEVLDVRKMSIEPLGKHKDTYNPDSHPEKHGKYKKFG